MLHLKQCLSALSKPWLSNGFFSNVNQGLKSVQLIGITTFVWLPKYEVYLSFYFCLHQINHNI